MNKHFRHSSGNGKCESQTKRSPRIHSEHSSCGMSADDAKDYLKKFRIVTILLIPLALSNEAVAGFLGLPSFEIGRWISFIIATIIFGFSLVFFKHARMEIKSRSYGMMTLVSIAVGAGYLFSVFATFFPQLEVEFYLEISTLIWVLLFGHYLEAKSGASASDALSEVVKLLPKKAHLLKDGKEIDVDIENLKEKDIVLVKPGEKVPADGEVIKGEASVNEALISGESKPIEKKPGDRMVAGSIVLDSTLEIRLNRVGENSTVGQIKTLVMNAQQTKPRSQRIADIVSGYLTVIALLVAIASLIVWYFIVGQSFVFAITIAITVLVVTCPHALGLAIPTVTSIGTSLAVKNGFFIKDLAKIETIRKADWVIFDKTGTLTEGEFEVNEIISLSERDEEEILKLISSLEQSSSHIVGISILKKAEEENITLSEIKNFKNIAGKGIAGEIEGKKYFVGNESLLKQIGIDDFSKIENDEKLKDKTLVFLADEEKVLGVVTLSDKIKEEARIAVENLRSLGIKTAMLTGDNKTVAETVSKELKIDKYFAEVLPEDKYKYIKSLQEEGNVVLMVGDGVNDAPALTQADAGIAIGAGTDVAVESGDVVLTNSNPADIAKLVRLSRAVYKKMIQNLWWALGYNILAVPAAAGVFYPWGVAFRPEAGALLMSFSTVMVVTNAMMLKRNRL